MIRTLFKVLGWLLALFFGFVFLVTFSAGWVVQLPFVLVGGWIPFLQHVLPEVRFNWAAIAETVGVGAVLGVGLDWFLRWLWGALRPAGSSLPERWPVRWSVSLLSGLVLLFLATMATVGIAHHVGWLAGTDQPLVESNWGFRARRLLRDSGPSLCREARDLLDRGRSPRAIAAELLRAPDSRYQAERLHLVPTTGPGDEVVFLLFPRDPLHREEVGVLRCGEKERKTYQARALPKLLAGEAVPEALVAQDTGY